MTPLRTRKSAGERKAEIVDAVLRLSAEIGPDRLTTEALAKEIGLSQAAIFRHFATKDDIWRAVAQRIGELLRAKSTLDQPETLRPVDRLRMFVTNHFAFLEETPAITAILFSRELHAGNEELRAFFAGLVARRQRVFAGLIRAECEAGLFRPSLDPDDAAYLVLALVQGLAMRWSLYGRSFDLQTEGIRLLEQLLQGFECSVDTPAGEGERNCNVPPPNGSSSPD